MDDLALVAAVADLDLRAEGARQPRLEVAHARGLFAGAPLSAAPRLARAVAVAHERLGRAHAEAAAQHPLGQLLDDAPRRPRRAARARGPRSARRATTFARTRAGSLSRRSALAIVVRSLPSALGERLLRVAVLARRRRS